MYCLGVSLFILVYPYHLFRVSIPCRYYISPFINKFSNLRPPVSYGNGLPYNTKMLINGALKTTHMVNLSNTEEPSFDLI